MATKKIIQEKWIEITSINPYKNFPKKDDKILWFDHKFIVKESAPLDLCLLLSPCACEGFLDNIKDIIVRFKDKKILASFIC